MPKYNFGTGLAAGATGAQYGSVFGPVGTVVGGLAGLATGLFGKKKKKKMKTRSVFDPQQQDLYNQGMAALRGEGPLADLYNFDEKAANDVFERTTARPAYRQFNEEIIPGITGQFRGGNIQNSSYTGEALGRAGRNVQENLDALRAQTNYQGRQDALNRKAGAIESNLNRTTFNYERPQESKGGFDQIINSLGPKAFEWLADYIGGKGSGTSGTAGG